MSNLKLFCFPYAGGSAVIFRKWKQYLHPAIELIPVELAGRGRRIQEPLYKDVPDLINDVYRLIKDEITQTPYALFGHSLGGMICYELAKKIHSNQLPPPAHIFFSGRSAPHVKKKDEKIFHRMSDAEFKKEVIALGGTAPEFFEQPELLELFLPLLKNDFRLAEADIYNGKIEPLTGNITVFMGKEDDLTPEQCDGWKKHTSNICTMHYFEGGHFFLHQETDKIVNIINRILN